MTKIIVHHDHTQLPVATSDTIPVQIYGLNRTTRNDICSIGSPILSDIKRLGLKLSPAVFDFLSIALAITAADTFIKRGNAADGWTRDIVLELSLSDPAPWERNKEKLERMLRFLSGDIWSFNFSSNGKFAPEPYLSKYRRKLINTRGLDCVSLFSGGLDSAIGAIDMLANGKKPLFISHKYKGDKSRQDAIADTLVGHYSRLSLNANPISSMMRRSKTEITMRTRSINFFAFAVVGAYVVQEVNQLSIVELFVPENGFISLNAPLTPRRIGSLSTRTTHPYFLGLLQDIFNDVGIKCNIINPYQFKTKGEMVVSCLDQNILRSVYKNTVSCSHWKRKRKQCGYCVPCIIRRSALKAGSFDEGDMYIYNVLRNILSEPDKRDDLLALSIAISKTNGGNIGTYLLDSGVLSEANHGQYKSVFVNGLAEVKQFFDSEGVI